MSERIYVTGIGIVSAIGFNVADALNSLVNQKSGIGKITHSQLNLKSRFLAGEVNASDDQLKSTLGIDQNLTYTRTSLLGMIAAREAVLSANIHDMSAISTGLVSATSVGGMNRGEIFYPDFIKQNRKARLRNIIHHDCGDSTERIADFLSIKDHLTTISTACSSSANSIMHGARLIKNGVVDRVVAGGTDSLTNFTINGFNSLNILSSELCKPFDNNRTGLNLGEGAGFVVLESERSLSKSKNKILCELKGYGNACDAYHQTASSPDGNGAFLSMNMALQSAGLSPDKIDYINAHGTGTMNNDLTEGKAMQRIFHETGVPKFSSTKAYTGHTLGACGGIEAVFSVLAILNQIVYPNMHFADKMEDLDLVPELSIQQTEVRNVLSNSFGFGGNNSTLIFSKC
jgi:3-oxoacyl-(acyl-carrier-protein) synthase